MEFVENDKHLARKYGGILLRGVGYNWNKSALSARWDTENASRFRQDKDSAAVKSMTETAIKIQVSDIFLDESIYPRENIRRAEDTLLNSNNAHSDVATSKVAFNIVGLWPNLLYYQQFSISACIISNDFVRSPKDNETLGFCLERDSWEELNSGSINPDGS